MRFVLAIALVCTFSVGCKKHKENARLANLDSKGTDQRHTVIRSIDVNIGTGNLGSRERVGIELNGDSARFILNPYSKDRQYYAISYREGLALLEQFEAIKDVSKHLEKLSGGLYEDSQYIVQLYTCIDTPERRKEDYLSYVYPKNESMSDGDFSAWLAAIQKVKEHAESGSRE